MIVNRGRRVASRRRARVVVDGCSKGLMRIGAASLATLLAVFMAPPVGWAASAPVLAAVPIALGGNVSCQGGACGIFDTNQVVGGESTTLDGTNSTMALGGAPIIQYAWSIDDGPLIVGQTLTGVSLTDGNHVASLTVTDSAGGTSSTDLALTVYGPSVAVIRDGDRRVSDSDKAPGESVTLSSVGSVFGDCPGVTAAACSNLTYKWTVNGSAMGVNSPTPTFRLRDGANTISLIVSDAGQASPASTAVTITVAAPPPTPVIANGDRTIADTDGKAGEAVTFDGQGSSAPDGATITAYSWSVNGVAVADATGAQATLALKDGTNTVSLAVTDSLEDIATVSVTITVSAAHVPTAAIAGGNRAVSDTDGKPGESVAFDANGSAAETGAEITSYSWSVNSTVVANASGPTPTLVLKEGPNTVSLVVTDSRGQQSAPASVTITVGAAQETTAAIAGGNRSVADADGLPGERVAMVGAVTGAGAGGVPESAFAWTATAVIKGQTMTVDSAQGTSKPTLRLRDGANTVTLAVTSSANGPVVSSSVTIMVAGSNVEGVPNPLSSIPGLTANQKSVARAIERSCSDLTAKYEASGTLAAAPTDLLQQCRALINDHGNAVDVPGLQNALDSLSGQQITEMQRIGLDFSDSQFKSLGDRLTELRRGHRGVSASGVHVQGGSVEMPLTDLVAVVSKALGGGAGDSAPLSELLRDRFGVFVTANLRIGDRDRSDRESAFDARSHGVTVGLDYRFTDSLVAGGAIGYSRAKSEFAAPQARLDSKSITASLYGSWYVGDGYLDFIASRGKLDYDSSRHILFTSSVVTATNGLVDRTALGSTSGSQTAFSASTGYDWHWRGLTTGPIVGLSYARVDIDGFGESGAEGLNLSFNDQSGDSFTLKAGGHASYALNTRFGVFMPHLQASAVHEFAATARSVTGRFQADVASAFAILADSPDRDYFNWSAGMSAQFPFGIAAFIDHQVMAGLAHTSMHDTSLGLRIAAHF
jgi:outer membrane lipase/esterase